jgi:hypothetical protein
MKYFLFYERVAKKSGNTFTRVQAVSVLKMTEKKYRQYGGKTSEERKVYKTPKTSSPFGWMAYAESDGCKISFDYHLDHITEGQYETYQMWGLEEARIEHSPRKDGPLFVCPVTDEMLHTILETKNMVANQMRLLT